MLPSNTDTNAPLDLPLEQFAFDIRCGVVAHKEASLLMTYGGALLAGTKSSSPATSVIAASLMLRMGERFFLPTPRFKCCGPQALSRRRRDRKQNSPSISQRSGRCEKGLEHSIGTWISDRDAPQC